MKKIYEVQIEIEVEDAAEQSLILAARDHYREGGGAEEPISGGSDDYRRIPAAESVPDTIGAIMQLLLDNAVLQKAGIDVVEASCHEVMGVRPHDLNRHA